MGSVRLLSEADLRQAVSLDLGAVDCVENAFKALATGKVVMPPILSLAIHENNGEVDVKTAYVPGLESFAIKVSPGFFDNPKLGLPSTSGLMMLFSAKTGVLEALLLDNGYLTDVRTAAAGAVAARHLAPSDAETACVLGAGMQSMMQLQALCLVRPIKTASVWARDAVKAAAFARKATETLGIPVLAESDPRKAVTGAQIVVTTTPATEPIMKADWLQPGQHVTAMGSDQETKNELEPACLSRATLYVPDRQSQTAVLGELRSAIAAGEVGKNVVFSELGDIISGKTEGRVGADDITIADLTGTGVQDTAIATYAAKRAAARNLGLDFNV